MNNNFMKKAKEITANQTSQEPEPILWKIPVYWKTVKNFKILETTYFGYKLGITGKYNVQKDADGLFIVYDINKAALVANQYGYMNLLIGD